jgi:outer membrane protein OmpA-like peptidoglycan-associated protein
VTLSGQRALTVKNAAIAKGVKKERLLAVGFGQNKPIGDNTTDEGKPRIAAPSSASRKSAARSTWASTPRRRQSFRMSRKALSERARHETTNVRPVLPGRTCFVGH